MGPQESLELKISKFLRKGVLLAGFFLIIGWISNLINHGVNYEQLHNYHEVSLLDALKLIIAKGDWGDLIGYTGMGLLIFLPISRVFLTAWLFIKQKDYLLAGIALFVLVALIISFTLGIEL